MALSQIQCLDNNHVNWRSSETKPEFYYSEEQRMALEALVAKGQDAFYEVVKKEGIRDFLSELELAKIASRVEPFDPETSHPKIVEDKTEQEPKGVEGEPQEGEGEPQEGEGEPQEDTPHSLEYWPDRSDRSIPELDLGWPDTVAYRGVTRATVYMQPPMDGQPHIKEVVRKMIAQAQKVIAVVMDQFTDVDIFKDMLDAGYKRKTSVYIILNESDVKYFLQMCEKAQMHKGHLKYLRVRCVGGSEFYTHFSSKFRGSLGQKFMFVDGDKAVCGSYSFTWSAARIDRNIITVLSGQVVETFDRQFQELYPLSKGVSLKNVPIDNEPAPEPVARPVSMPTGPPEAIAKKLINPKYALVNVKSASETDKDSKQEDVTKKVIPKPRVSAFDQHMDETQMHPALKDMEKANMFDYLPTWVEPDPEPGSEILGYINIIDPSIKNAQLSQMNRIKICDTSQATAQFLQQSREQEIKKNQENLSSNHNSLSRQASQDQKSEHSHQQDQPSRKSSQDQGSEHSHNRGSPTKQDSPGQVSEQCPSRGNPPRQSSQDQESLVNSNKESISRQASQGSSVPSANKVSIEPSNITQNLVNQDINQDAADPDTTNKPCPQTPVGGFAELAESHHLVPVNKDVETAGAKPPPIPKPRTLPVNDFIIMKNALNAKSGNTSTPAEENMVPSVNGVDAEDIDLIIENGPIDNDQDEEDSNAYQSCTGEYSSSGSGSLPPSNASSMSEEYYPSMSFHRRSSDHIPNGEHPPLHRKLSDSHISRGSFVSPFNTSQTLMDMRNADNGKRTNPIEELQRALSANHPPQGNDRFYTLETPQVCTDVNDKDLPTNNPNM